MSIHTHSPNLQAQPIAYAKAVDSPDVCGFVCMRNLTRRAARAGGRAERSGSRCSRKSRSKMRWWTVVGQCAENRHPGELIRCSPWACPCSLGPVPTNTARIRSRELKVVSVIRPELYTWTDMFGLYTRLRLILGYLECVRLRNRSGGALYVFDK